MGGVRGDGGAAQRRVRWLLVHLVPHDAREKERTYEANRALKCRLVDRGPCPRGARLRRRRGRGLVPVRVTRELPNIYHRKQYEEELDVLPDYRITCIFVDKRYRRQASRRLPSKARST